ncbi:MAG: gamma-glutamyltransferase [Candidimonas sp.]|nr:MAG: gamma-glutamyltransferase [Candidimonas sp.]
MRPSRATCRAENGMVATAHYLGSDAALDALKRGGTAVDAAIAAASTMSVVLPHMVGLGGDAFWLIYDAQSRKVHAINGSGPAGARVTAACYAGEDSVPHRGPRAAITVPGAVDSWRLAHERYGRLTMPELLTRAITYARDGAPVSADLSSWIATDRDTLAADPGSTAVFLRDGAAPAAGARLRQEALASTLERLADHGLRTFYTQTGRGIAAYLAAAGGYLDATDFADYQAHWVNPITTRYRGYEAYQLPPPSQGVAASMILNFLDGLDLGRFEPDSSGFYHALIQATKWAFQKRDRYLCDPRFGDIPLSRLLAPSLAAAERDRWLQDPLRMVVSRASGGDTTFICTADAEGNAVGLVQSLYFDFGACVADPDSGVVMQNRGSFFSLDPAHPNALRPGKQPASTLMSAMLLKDGDPYLVYGSQGGEVQPQAQTALVTRIVDFGLDVQGALDAPRVLYGRTWGDDGSKLLLESSAPQKTFDELRARGHPVQTAQWPHTRMGTAQAIRLKGPWSEFFEGGADVRGEGIALGF